MPFVNLALIIDAVKEETRDVASRKPQPAWSSCVDIKQPAHSRASLRQASSHLNDRSSNGSEYPCCGNLHLKLCRHTGRIVSYQSRRISLGLAPAALVSGVCGAKTNCDRAFDLYDSPAMRIPCSRLSASIIIDDYLLSQRV